MHDDFLAAVVKEAEGWRLGDPFDDATLVGPMNNEPTAQKMDAHLEDAVARGAEVVLGGRDGGRPTELYYQPTVVDGVGVDTLINRDETFGPIVPLITVADDDEALTVANDSHLGLQAAVYTRSLKRAFRYLDNLQVETSSSTTRPTTGRPTSRSAAPPVPEPGGVGSEVVTRCST